MEEWKKINGYENYQISSDGKIKNEKGKILKPFKTNSGYLMIHLFDGNRTKHYVHRLVAEAFINNTGSFNEVNHIDGNKQNNNSNNLEWCSKSHNQLHACYTLMKTVKPVKCIETGIIFPSIHDAAKRTGSSRSGISMCCNGKQEKANKLHWGFVT